MAYTYDDFLKKVNQTGMLPQFSQEDVETSKTHPEFGLSLITLKQDAANASTPEARLLAQEAEGQLRKTYRTAGGVAPVAGSFSDGNGSDGAVPLTDTPADPAFSYDPEKDPRFIAYKKAYLREGDRAAANALARASALTGGVPSTHAVTASQQAGDYYSGKLADIIPSLYGEAYDEFLNERNYQYQLEKDKQDAEQQKILNALNLYNTLGYATPEIAEILGLDGAAAGSVPGLGTPGSGSGGGGGYDNQGYSTEEIKALQGMLGVAQDGKWGQESQSALSQTGLTLKEAMDALFNSPDGVDSNALQPQIGQIPQAEKQYLSSKWDDGKITDKAEWDRLVGLYGENALAAAGFSLHNWGNGIDTTTIKTGKFVGGKEIEVASDWDMVKEDVNMLIGRGNWNDLTDYIDANVDRMSQEQYAEIMNMIKDFQSKGTSKSYIPPVRGSSPNKSQLSQL